MATVAQIQAQLDPQGLANRTNIVKQFRVSTTDTFYCTGGVDYPGRARWVTTTNTDTAAQQATSIRTGMAA